MLNLIQWSVTAILLFLELQNLISQNRLRKKIPSRLREWLKITTVACLAFMRPRSDFMVSLLSQLPPFPLNCNSSQYIKETIHVWELMLCPWTNLCRALYPALALRCPSVWLWLRGPWPIWTAVLKDSCSMA